MMKHNKAELIDLYRRLCISIASTKEENERLKSDNEGLRTTIDRMLVDKEQSAARSKEWTGEQQAKIKELEELLIDIADQANLTGRLTPDLYTRIGKTIE